MLEPVHSPPGLTIWPLRASCTPPESARSRLRNDTTLAFKFTHAPLIALYGRRSPSAPPSHPARPLCIRDDVYRLITLADLVPDMCICVLVVCSHIIANFVAKRFCDRCPMHHATHSAKITDMVCHVLTVWNMCQHVNTGLSTIFFNFSTLSEITKRHTGCERICQSEYR